MPPGRMFKSCGWVSKPQKYTNMAILCAFYVRPLSYRGCHFLGRNHNFWPKIEIFRNFDEIATQTGWSRSISMKCNSLVKASNNHFGHPDPNSLVTQPLPSAGTADHASGNHWPELAFCLARMDPMVA